MDERLDPKKDEMLAQLNGAKTLLDKAIIKLQQEDYAYAETDLTHVIDALAPIVAIIEKSRIDPN